jgi:hypothetical protein
VSTKYTGTAIYTWYLREYLGQEEYPSLHMDVQSSATYRSPIFDRNQLICNVYANGTLDSSAPPCKSLWTLNDNPLLELNTYRFQSKYTKRLKGEPPEWLQLVHAIVIEEEEKLIFPHNFVWFMDYDDVITGPLQPVGRTVRGDIVIKILAARAPDSLTSLPKTYHRHSYRRWYSQLENFGRT